ncbi:MAG: hypothetical protein ICV83_34220, partial [Cytophagales bacterium]|nr:hypothetical protein [Cytophagales bacterium]
LALDDSNVTVLGNTKYITEEEIGFLKRNAYIDCENILRAYASPDGDQAAPGWEETSAAGPAPEAEAPGAAAVEAAAPAPGTEAILTRIWEEVLSQTGIAPTDDFFDLGGQSLTGFKVLLKIEQQFKLELEIDDLFDYPVLQELSAYIEGKLGKDNDKATAPKAATAGIPVVPPQPSYRVSHAQRRLWIVNQLNRNEVIYNEAESLLIRGALDLPAFLAAFDALVARHESLRTTFTMLDEEPRQVIHAPGGIDFKVAFVNCRGREDRETYVAALAAAEAATPFDLEKGPLIRVKLFQLEAERFVLCLTMHHIISDGWSRKVLTQELVALYAAYRANTPHSLPPLNIQYKDYAEWQHTQWTAGVIQEQKAYWLEQFRGEIPVLTLRLDHARVQLDGSQRGANVQVQLDKTLKDSLAKVSQQNGVSLFMTLLAAINVILYKNSRQTDLVVGSPIAGREHADLENQIGFYVNMLAFRTRFSTDYSFEGLLEEVRKVTLGAYKNQSFPFDVLIKELNVQRDLTRSPLFDVVLVLQNADAAAAAAVEEVSIESFGSGQTPSRYDVQFNVVENADSLLVDIHYRSDLFSESRMQQMLSELVQ